MTLKRKNILYYTRIMPDIGIYDLCEMIVRTVDDDWFTAVDKRTKQAFLFSYKDIGEILFEDREEALIVIKKAEKHKRKISTETCYVEY